MGDMAGMVGGKGRLGRRASRSWLDDEETAAWLAFREAGLRVFHSVEQQLKDEVGLSHQQYEILVRLSDAAPDGMRMTELAETLVTSKSGLTYQAGQLEKRGLVIRESCPTDERGVTARLTGEGLAVLKEAAAGHLERVRDVLIDALDREQLRVVANALGAVGTRLRGQG